jgi:hypothetical protein
MIWDPDLLTAGLNKPPLTRKNIQALTAKLKPKLRAIYKRILVSEAVMVVLVVPCWTSVVLATWVPPVAGLAEIQGYTIVTRCD